MEVEGRMCVDFASLRSIDRPRGECSVVVVVWGGG